MTLSRCPDSSNDATRGGGRVKDSSGGMTITKDLKESNDSKAIMQAKENGTIIPVIAGMSPLSPCP
jgi:hypothetical protein